MKKKFRWIRLMIFILPLSLILLFLFLPIGLRLTLLGFKDSETYTFTAYEETYIIEVSDERIESIHVNQSFDSVGPLRLTYPTDISAVHIESDALMCEYTLIEATLTCEESSLSDTEIQTLKDHVVYHYFVINESFNWRIIPKSQR